MFRGLRELMRALGRRRELESELDEEVRFHLERETEQNIARGMGPEEARYAALRAFGGVEQVKEDARDVRGVRFLEEAWHDLRYGARSLVRNRGFAVVAILTLGLGIGANTAVFSVIDAVFLKALPFHEPDRLVVVWEEASFDGYPTDTPSPGNYLDWKATTTVFEELAAIASTSFSVTGDGEPERITAQRVTANLFPTLGVQPMVGRGFLAEEDREGGPRAVILSHGLWQRRYGGAEVLGREIRLDGEPYTVVGVMAPNFQVLHRGADAWVPIAFGPQDAESRGSHYLRVVARLKPGVTLDQAQAEMQATMERIARDFPQQAARRGAVVVPLHEQLVGDVRQPLAVLMVAVGLVLLIACINVGNLMLSRAVGRRREIAVRAALGASRTRVLRQLLVENVPLVLCGTVVGLLFAYWSVDLLKQLVPPQMQVSTAVGLDVRVLAFTLAVAVIATVLFGLVPAFQASKADLNEAMRSGGARAGVSVGGRLQRALVVGEVCLAIALLVGASLLIQTFLFLRWQYSELGTSSVLTMKTLLSRSAYDTHEKRAAFFDGVLERMRALPGVAAVGYTNALPLDYKGDANSFAVEGRPPEPGPGPSTGIRLVGGEYLKALGVPLRRGRHLAGADVAGAQPVAVVNETMARMYWPGEEAIGKRFKIGGPQSDAPWLTIVGVVADVRQNGVDAPVKAESYIPYAQCDYIEIFAPRTFAIRMAGDQAGIVAAARHEIAAVDPNQPVSDVQTMSDIIGDETSGRRLGTLLVGAFAAVALLLASIGIYGLLSQLVEQKTPEIGVRMALGAAPRNVVALVVGQGMKLVLVGSLAGLALSLALTRLMSSLLFGVSTGDPLTLAGVPMLLGAVALVACYLPARRASRVDPNIALRAE